MSIRTYAYHGQLITNFFSRSHTMCQCTHLTNFALLMQEGLVPLGAVPNSHQEGTLPLLIQGSSGGKSQNLSVHISTIVAIVAALISISVIIFFLVMAWRRLKMSNQCRSALEKSGLPCFHKSKDLADKDKGNKGNFYTVTPKLNGQANNAQRGSDEPSEVVEAQQFFEHMISLQKNPEGKVGTKRGKNAADQQEAAAAAALQIEEPKANNIENAARRQLSDNVGYPKRNNYARALSPYNHIYMEIDPTDVDPSASGGPVYEPLTHSETYMMSTVSDMSEDYSHLNNPNNYSDVSSRQSSSRESRPLIRAGGGSLHERNLLHTISGVLHSQSVRIAPNHQHHHTLNPSGMRRTMLANVRQANGQTLAQQIQQSGSNTMGRISDSSSVPLMERIRQGLDPNAIPMQVISGTAAAAAAANGGSLRPIVTTRDNLLLGRIAQAGQQQQQQVGQTAGGDNVPVQVTTMNGHQFVCLNINQEQPDQATAAFITTAATADQPAAHNGLPNNNNSSVVQNPNRPGQVQPPVHSQTLMSPGGSLNFNQPRPQHPQFTRPVQN